MASEPPRILAFDTSGPWCSVALRIGGRTVASAYEDMRKGQAEALFPMIGKVLDETGLHWGDLAAVAVGTGPGNFTGIRIAVSAARGLSMALDIPAIGVSLFEAMSRTARGVSDGPWLISLPSSRRDRDVVVQYFEDGTPVGTALELVIHEDTQGENPSGFNGFPGKPLVVGHQAKALKSALSGDDGSARPLDFGPALPPAEAIAGEAEDRMARRDSFEPPAPLYVRPADAAPARDAGPVILPT